jgi:hypothetical protein
MPASESGKELNSIRNTDAGGKDGGVSWGSVVSLEQLMKAPINNNTNEK